MKHPILITIIAAAFLFGCSDPEGEANKLFTEASQLVKDADSLRDQFGEDVTVKLSVALSRLRKIQNQYPKTSFALMISQEDFKISGLTLQDIRAGISYKLSFSSAVGSNYNFELVKKYIAAGVDVNDPNHSNGNQPLIEACLRFSQSEERKNLVKMLIEQEANVNVMITDGGYWRYSTPLLVAIESGNSELTELLIKNGADVNLLDKKINKTPLDRIEYLIQPSQSTIEEINKLKDSLREYWHSDYSRIEAGRSAAMNEIADLLRKHGAKRGKELKAQGK